MHDIEAGLARCQLDHNLLPLLLFGNLLGRNRDAGEVGEFLLVLLQDLSARAFQKVDLDRGPSKFLPLRLCKGWRSGEAPGARHLEKRTARWSRHNVPPVSPIRGDICCWYNS